MAAFYNRGLSAKVFKLVYAAKKVEVSVSSILEAYSAGS
jgi:hypothetical protein